MSAEKRESSEGVESHEASPLHRTHGSAVGLKCSHECRTNMFLSWCGHKEKKNIWFLRENLRLKHQ